MYSCKLICVKYCHTLTITEDIHDNNQIEPEMGIYNKINYVSGRDNSRDKEIEKENKCGEFHLIIISNTFVIPS